MLALAIQWFVPEPPGWRASVSKGQGAPRAPHVSSMAGYMIGTYAVAFVGKIVASWLGDLWSRHSVYVLGCIGAAVFLPVIVFLYTRENIVWLMLFFGFLYGVALGTMGAFMSENFATRIRGTAVGGSYNVGRFCSGAAPVMIGYVATQFLFGVSFLMVGAVFFLSGICAFFIPDRLYDTSAPEANDSGAASASRDPNAVEGATRA